MKRISFKTAKALKEAGYPQEAKEYECSYSEYDSESKTFVLIPYAMEVLLWLWREKKIAIELLTDYDDLWFFDIREYVETKSLHDPEEAIIAAVEYLVENDLIK